jgi:hypothetical protein
MHDPAKLLAEDPMRRMQSRARIVISLADQPLKKYLSSSSRW